MALTEEVIEIVDNVLKLGERASSMNRETLLLGNIPEFDSMAVVSVITALEESFDIVVDDDEIDADVFETVGTLVEFMEGKLED